jgi:hypothetical protein
MPLRVEPVGYDPFLPPPVDPRGARGTAAGEFLGRLVTTPRKAVKQGITTEEAVPWAADVASLLGGGGSVRAGLGAAKGQAGVFGGELAATADREALKLAQRMEAKGLARDQIWDATGWFRGVDKKWRYEIPDIASAAVPGKPPTLGEKLVHEKAYEAYPDLADIRMQYSQPMGTAFQRDAYEARGRPIPATIGLPKTERYAYRPPGRHETEKNPLYARPEFIAHLNREEERNLALHEMQHAIQSREGFALGGDPKSAEIMNMARSQLPGGQPVSPQWVDDVARQIYRRLAGEVEARNVQSRAKLAETAMRVAEREGKDPRPAGPQWLKENPPWRTEDVPAAEQWPRGMRAEPVDYDPFK